MGEVSVEIRCTVKPYENYCKAGENMAAGHIAVARRYSDKAYPYGTSGSGRTRRS